MKAFLPPLDRQWRLLEDANIPKAIGRYDNKVLATNFDVDLSVRAWPEWQERRGDDSYAPWSDEDRSLFNQWRNFVIEQANAKLPAGTVIQFNRYHHSHSGDDQCTVEILSSPDLRISPKKAGGKAKGKMRIYLTLAEVNGLGEMEEVTP